MAAYSAKYGLLTGRYRSFKREKRPLKKTYLNRFNDTEKMLPVIEADSEYPEDETVAKMPVVRQTDQPQHTARES